MDLILCAKINKNPNFHKIKFWISTYHNTITFMLYLSMVLDFNRWSITVWTSWCSGISSFPGLGWKCFLVPFAANGWWSNVAYCRHSLVTRWLVPVIEKWRKPNYKSNFNLLLIKLNLMVQKSLEIKWELLACNALLVEQYRLIGVETEVFPENPVTC